jgi:hypothetical protein
MPDRRYSDDDVHRILAAAAEAEAADAGAAGESGGMTLPEIQRIAAEAGLDPAAVTAAAAALEQAPRATEAPRLLGLPVGVRESVPLARPLDDGEWRRLVTLLRDTFEAEGREEQLPGRRAWRNGNLRVAMESVGDATLLELRTRKESASGFVRGGAGLLATSLVAGTAVNLFPASPGAGAGVLMLALGGAAMMVVGALPLPWWSATRRRQFAAVADYARRLAGGGSVGPTPGAVVRPDDGPR